MDDRALATTVHRFVVIIVLASLLSSTATAVVIHTLSFNPIYAGSGTLQQSGDIVLQDQDLLYSGTKLDGVNATINNTAATVHDVDIHVAVRDDTGSVLVQKTTATTISGNTVATETVDFARANEPKISNVDEVDITLEVTA